MEKKYPVFVSSTYEDLQTERQAVMGTLLEKGFIPVGMEQFPASPLSQWDYITKMIDNSDYYVLIVAGKYGSIDPDTGISYTQKEYQYAVEKGVPVLTFLHSDVNSIPFGKCEQDQEKRKRLEDFRELLKNAKRLVQFYENPDDLKVKISNAITQAVIDSPRPGWIRGSGEDPADITDEVSRVSKENETLKLEVAELRETLRVGTFDEIAQDRNSSAFMGISNDASVLLVYAGASSNGEIIFSRTISGTSISAGRWNFVGDGGRREEARWQAAIEELERAGYIEQVGTKGEIYQVTHMGYELSDKIVFDCKIDTKNSPEKYLYE